MESLYRKYRPQTFDDVVGQKHVVATLRRAVLEGRTSHAYLFCGPRGTGKTTMARLLAKALLCEQGEGHLPDGTCEQCQLIAAGEHPDVYELDAASNTGVDNVREEIINRVNYAPVRGAYKVYIIDEVHMLTTAAFNALLKTLEEPPSHVVFVLCTTDPQKVLETILSRVQRFDFHAISNPELLERLRYVCEQEQIEADADALALIARHARGGMRDALTKLEQLATATSGKVSFSAAQALLGEVSASTLASIVTALAQRDIARLFSEVGALVAEGHDLLQFTHELSSRLRDAYVLSVVGPREGVIDAQGDDLRVIAEEAEAFGVSDRISRALAILADATTEMRVATNQRLVLEVALTRIARPESDVTMDALAERLAVLEQRVAKLAAGEAVRVPPTRPSAVQTPQPAAAPQQVQDVSAPPAEQKAPAPQPAVRSERQEAPQGRPAAPAPQRAPQRPAPAQASPKPAPAPRQQVPAPPAAAEQRPVAQEQVARPVEARPAPASQGVSDPGDLQRRWQRVVEGLLQASQPRGALLRSSDPVSDDGSRLVVALPKGSSFALKMLDRNDVRSIIDPIVGREFGHRHVVYVEVGQATSAAPRAATSAQPASRAAAPRPAAATPQPAAQASAAPVVQPQPPVARPAQAQSAPQPASAPKPVPAPQPDYPMPWDDLPPYEEVPYDDAYAVSFEDEWGEEGFAPAPAQPAAKRPTAQVPQHSPAPAAAPVAAAPAPVAAAPVPSAAPAQPAPAPRPAPQPAPATPKPVAPAPQPAPAPKPAQPAPAASAPAAPTSSDVADLAAAMLPGAIDGESLAAMLTAAFGEGVNITIEPRSADYEPDEDDGDEYDPNAGYTEDPDEYDEY